MKVNFCIFTISELAISERTREIVTSLRNGVSLSPQGVNGAPTSMKLRMARCQGGTSTTMQAGLSRLLPVRSEGDRLLLRLLGAQGVAPGGGGPPKPNAGDAFSSIGVVAGLLAAMAPWCSGCRPSAPADLPRCRRPEPPDEGHGISGNVRYRDDS
jgi:hypothetical protein